MGLFRRATEALRSGLTKTRTALTGVFGALAGRKIDEDALQTIEASLLRADVGPALSTSLVESLRTAWRQGTVTTGEEARDHLAQDLRERLGDHRGNIARAEQGPTVLLVVGVNGAGKTTSIAKLAKRFSAEGKVVLAAADTFRAGAVHQLEVWAERLGVDIIKGKEGADPAAVAWDGAEAAVARNADFLIVDTAGRLHVQEELMRQLSKIKDVLGRVIPNAPHESLLVLDATAGQNGLRQAEHFWPQRRLMASFWPNWTAPPAAAWPYPFVNTPASPSNLLGPVSDQKTLRCSTPSHMSTHCSASTTARPSDSLRPVACMRFGWASTTRTRREEQEEPTKHPT